MSNAVSIADVQAGKQIAVKSPSQSLERAAPFSSLNAFEAAQRMAAALNASTMVPQQYRGRENIGNALIALEVAQRNGSSVFAVMQELYVVHGKPAWSSKYLIATINQSGRFSEPLQYEFKGEQGQDDWSARAFTFSKNGNRIDGPWVSIAIAKKEGWYGKNGSKWQTMPELMLRYRAASQFCNTVCPELALGMKTTEEVADIIDIDPETGEVLDRSGDRKGRRVKTVAEAANVAPKEKAPEDQTYDEFEDSLPIPPGSPEAEARAKHLAEFGWFEDENGCIGNALGEVWNQDIHATSTETGGPIINSDGSFRARRGTAKASTPDDGGDNADADGTATLSEAAELAMRLG